MIISDVDVMWLRDPIPFFKKFPDADILTSTDHLTPTIGGAETLERYPDAGSAFNIGEIQAAVGPCASCGLNQQLVWTWGRGGREVPQFAGLVCSKFRVLVTKA